MTVVLNLAHGQYFAWQSYDVRFQPLVDIGYCAANIRFRGEADIVS